MRTTNFLTWAAGTPEMPGMPVRVTRDLPPGPGEIVRVLDGLGLDTALPDIRATHTRIREIASERRDAEQSVAGGRAGVQTKLTAGDLTLAEAVEALGRLDKMADPKGPAAMLAKRATTDLVTRAQRTLRSLNDEIVDELRPAADRIVARSVELAGTLPDSVTGDREALGAGGTVAETWTELTALYEQWQQLHDLADRLRSAGILDHADSDLGGWETTGVKAAERDFLPDVGDLAKQFLPVEYRHAHPGRAEQSPVELALARAHAAGQGPGLYSAAEVRAHRAERAKRAERVPA